MAACLPLINIPSSGRYDSASSKPASLEPLDDGELDAVALRGAVRAVGFDGPVGIRGHSVGDSYPRLRRSLTAYHDIERRLDAHREWASLRPPL